MFELWKQAFWVLHKGEIVFQTFKKVCLLQLVTILHIMLESWVENLWKKIETNEFKKFKKKIIANKTYVELKHANPNSSNVIASHLHPMHVFDFELWKWS